MPDNKFRKNYRDENIKKGRNLHLSITRKHTDTARIFKSKISEGEIKDCYVLFNNSHTGHDTDVSIQSAFESCCYKSSLGAGPSYHYVVSINGICNIFRIRGNEVLPFTYMVARAESIHSFRLENINEICIFFCHKIF